MSVFVIIIDILNFCQKVIGSLYFRHNKGKASIYHHLTALQTGRFS